MLKRHVAAAVLATSMLVPAWAGAADQPALDACIGSWGSASPFKKGTPAASVVESGVKVFGIGKESTPDKPAAKSDLRGTFAPLLPFATAG